MKKIYYKIPVLVFALFIFNSSFFISNCMCQWVRVSNGMEGQSVISLAYSGNIIFAGTNVNGVFLSTNNGVNWTQTTLNNRNISSLAVNGNNIFAGTNAPAYGVYLSTNNGTSWTQTSLNNRGVISLAVNGNNIFAGCGAGYGVYLSTNNGTSWTWTSLNNRSVNALAVNGNNVFAGCGPGYGSVYLSTNNGTNWTQSGLNSYGIVSLAVTGNNIFAGTNNPGYGVFLSTNNGTNWTQSGLSNLNIWSLAVTGNNIFAGTPPQNGVYVSNDNGASWTLRNEGLENHYVQAFCILNNYIFAGSNDSSVYRRPLNEVIGIKPISNKVPSSFSLIQNYPNPFNPTTNIGFRIAEFGFVSLKIYDMLGKEIKSLVSENLKPGTYEVDWDATNYPSGIYYYKLIAGNYSQSKKMILIK